MFCSVQDAGRVHLAGGDTGVCDAVFTGCWTHTLVVPLRDLARAHQRACSGVMYLPELACFTSNWIDLPSDA